MLMRDGDGLTGNDRLGNTQTYSSIRLRGRRDALSDEIWDLLREFKERAGQEDGPKVVHI